jgi:DNA-directed RNA polymerase specialized sigma24 family protein
MGVMSDVTRILSQVDAGDPAAAEQLLPLVYDELRKLAAAKLGNESSGQTLQATALVHEAYLRLVESPAADGWKSTSASRSKRTWPEPAGWRTLVYPSAQQRRPASKSKRGPPCDR